MIRVWALILLPSAVSLGLSITTTSLPGATQYQAYSATVMATGGTPPYTWSVTTADATLPEGMTINSSSGVISSSAVGGQGGYEFQVKVKDSASNTATALLTINVTGDNKLGGCAIFPADSIFHYNLSSLPVDTSPAAPIPSAYQSAVIKPYFGSDASPYPNGIPFIRVPYNQPLVTTTFTVYPTESDPGPYPLPANAPIEATANNGAMGGDGHVSVLQTAGGRNPCRLWEVYMGVNHGDGTWDGSNGAHWNLSSDVLRTLSYTSADAAGLPVMPLTVNYDEVASGAVKHPIRFTLNHTLNYMVWPARHAAGIGSCTGSGGGIRVASLISQTAPPISCTMSAPMGEIYRLKASVDTSVCASYPQSSVILTAMKSYGIIVADNGNTGAIIGTPDARWNNTDLACLENFKLSQFEPVNVGVVQVSADSGATLQGSGANSSRR
jgi:hypothetical protein